MNARQTEAMSALRRVSARQPRVEDRAMAALRKNSPTADDILENEGYAAELNDEIRSTYGQEMPPETAPLDATPPEAPMHETLPEPTLDLDTSEFDAILEKERAEREAKEQKETTPAEPELSREERIKQQIMELLAKSPGAPNMKQVELLKQRYGQNGVHVCALGEGDVYIFTYLRRGQWKKIQEYVNKAAQTEAFAGKADEMLREKVLQSAVIWPKVDNPEFLYNSRAGVMDTLYEMVMLHSYFLNPQQAVALTISL